MDSSRELRGGGQAIVYQQKSAKILGLTKRGLNRQLRIAELRLLDNLKGGSAVATNFCWSCTLELELS